MGHLKNHHGEPPTFLAFADASKGGGAFGVDVTLPFSRASLVRPASLLARAALCVVTQGTLAHAVTRTLRVLHTLVK